jgi:methionyl-tRNA formyltransferase
MMQKDLRIVFMGTPEFAVPCLEILVDNGWNVVGVVTTPDKPSGRGLQLTTSPVKEYALRKNLKVLQPEKLKNPEFIQELQSLEADLQVVVAFRMLPEAVWNMPPKGTFNLHASLLPQYRGAAPINWAIINGETETGVTTFFLQHEIDTGDIIFQDKESIGEDDNIGTLYERLMHKGAQLVLKTVQAVAESKVISSPQQFGSKLKSAPKIFRETCQIDWSKTATEIHNLVRGLSPYPAAFCVVNGKNCKIFKTSIDKETKSTEPLLSDHKTFLKIKCADDYLDILELQLEGKKRMPIGDFLRGTQFVSVQ